MAFYELRQYDIRPGKMESWLKMFAEEILPFQVARGMVVPAIMRGETDDGVFVWIRRFESEADRERLYAAVYEDDHWTSDLSPRVGEHIDRDTIKVMRLTPAAMSILR